MESADLGLEIKLLRERRRITGKELAQRIGLSQSQMSRLEKGERRIEATLLGKIAQVLEVTPAIFFRDTGPLDQPEFTPKPPTEPEPSTSSPPTARMLGRRIRDARRRLHLTAEELAYKIGRGRAFVLSIEDGEIELLNKAVTLKLAKALRLDSMDFLDAQRGEIRTLQRKVARLQRAHSGLALGVIQAGDSSDQAEAGVESPRVLRGIPVIVGPDGGPVVEVSPDGLPEGDATEHVYVPGIVDDAAFALIQGGDDMAPAILDGDVCVFSPTSEVRHGDLALAVVAGASRPIIRQVFFDPRTTVRLQPASVSQAPLLVKRESLDALVRMVARIQRL